MTLHEEITRIGEALDAYAARADRKGVATEDGDGGVPSAMFDGPVDGEGWVTWRMLASTLREGHVVDLETELGHRLPRSFRAYLLARLHKFDQAYSERHQQLIFTTPMPSTDPLGPLRELMRAWWPLIEGGYVPFAQWGDAWGPMCLDTAARADGADGDCPIVWFDHERIELPPPDGYEAREWVQDAAEPLYDSFAAFFEDVFGD